MHSHCWCCCYQFGLWLRLIETTMTASLRHVYSGKCSTRQTGTVAAHCQILFATGSAIDRKASPMSQQPQLLCVHFNHFALLHFRDLVFQLLARVHKPVFGFPNPSLGGSSICEFLGPGLLQTQCQALGRVRAQELHNHLALRIPSQSLGSGSELTMFTAYAPRPTST